MKYDRLLCLYRIEIVDFHFIRVLVWKIIVRKQKEQKTMTLSPIYCSECGSQNVPGAKFCVTCGHVMHVPEVEMTPAAINALGTGLLPQDSLLNKRYRI